MHKETFAASHGGHTTSSITAVSSSFLKSCLQPSEDFYGPLCSPVFPYEQYLPGSLSFIPYGISESNSASASASAVIRKRLHFTRAVQEQQEIVNRHSLCLTHLREATEEAKTLRHENTRLRCVNSELNKHLSVMIHEEDRPQTVSSDYSMSYDIVNGFRGLHVGGKGGSSSMCDDVSDESPTSVMENERIENLEVERFSLPKSISVRSNGYLNLKMAQTSANGGGPIRTFTTPRTASPTKVAQKVYVPAGKKDDEALELEVYNQGMCKTELCNKWQETGACSYGDHCQFAHGIEELRPVIRHPRYKTEVCKMVLSGVVCPYGHRCHFRHALTDQERLMGALNPPSTIKLERSKYQS